MATNSAKTTVKQNKTLKENASKPCRASIGEAKLPADVLESIWLAETRDGTDVRLIARREKMSVRRVQMGVTRARLREMAKIRRRSSSSSGAISYQNESGTKPDAKTLPHLIPLFPIGPFTPSSSCGHRHPIRAGSAFCCMVCHASGIDDHPELKRDPKTDPKPEPKSSSSARQKTEQLLRRDPGTIATKPRKVRPSRRNALNSPAAAVG